MCSSCCTQPVKGTGRLMSYCSKKCTENHNRKARTISQTTSYWTVLRWTVLARTGGDNDRADNESVLQHNSTYTIATLKTVGDGAICKPTGWTRWRRGREMDCLNINSISPPPRWRLPVTDRTEDLQGGLKVHKVVYVAPSKTGKMLPWENVEFEQYLREEKKPVFRFDLLLDILESCVFLRIQHGGKSPSWWTAY